MKASMGCRNSPTVVVLTCNGDTWTHDTSFNNCTNTGEYDRGTHHEKQSITSMSQGLNKFNIPTNIIVQNFRFQSNKANNIRISAGFVDDDCPESRYDAIHA